MSAPSTRMITNALSTVAVIPGRIICSPVPLYKQQWDVTKCLMKISDKEFPTAVSM